MGEWLKKNWINAILFAVVAGLLIRFFRDMSLPEILQAAWAIFLVAFGLSFVIFFHELGHFLAAKWCGVRVHTFSIGFGPAIPGLSYKKAETEYRIASFPLGGYVQMLGQEDPGVEAKEGFSEDDPRSYKNKTVGQRMFIISAGVVMNVILGMICFVLVYLTGKMEVSGRLGMIEPGSPADVAGLQAGAELLQIDENLKPTYEDLFFRGAFSTPNETNILLRWRTPMGEEVETHVVPRQKDDDPKPLIGIAPPPGNVLLRTAKPGKSPAYEGTAAADAEFLPGDQIVGLRVEGESESIPVQNGADLARAEFACRGKVVDYEVNREESNVTITVQPEFIHTLGLRMKMAPIFSVGADNPTVKDKLKKGDVILEVDGDKDFNPLRLPDLMADKAGVPVKLLIQRKGEEEPIEVEVTPLVGRGSWDEEPPMSKDVPASIPSLGITYHVTNEVVAIEEGSPAEGKIQPGDVIQSVTFQQSEDAKAKPMAVGKDEWAYFFWTLQLSPFKNVELKVKSADSKEQKTVALDAVEDKTWARADRGLQVEGDTQLVYASGVWEALQLGFRDTYRMIGRVYLNLKGLVTGMLSPRLMSGPIEIVRISYGMAERGINALVLFLGMISVNLAVINFLPIPILDGGHMVFLLWEKVNGKPASEKAQIVANLIGLALLGCLMLFVIILDISKMF